MANNSPKRCLRNASNAGLCGSSSSSPRYRRLSSTLSTGTPNRSAKRTLPIEVFGDMEFARRLAEPRDDQDQRRQRPGNMLLSRRQRPLQELVQSESLDEFQGQPRTAELPAVLDPYSRAVDLDEPRRGVVFREQSLLQRWRLRDRPPARRPAGLLRPSAPDRPPFAAAGRARCDTIRPAPKTLRADRCAAGSKAAGTCPHVSDDSQDFFPLHAIGGKKLRPTRTPSPARHDLRRKKDRKNPAPTDFLETLGKLG